MRAAFITKAEPLALSGVDDVSVPTPGGDLGLRLYRPIEGNLPIALFFHGGGWMLNDLDTHDHMCRHIAKRSGWLLASLDYRRAPEHKHPTALEDAYIAYRWILDNSERIGCDATCRALVGESSGGTMAASLTLMLRNLGAPLPRCQIIAYPLTDSLGRWPSYTERGSGYVLDRDQIKWFLEGYVPEGGDSTDQYLYPLAASDLSGLPSTLVMTAEFDPLRDEGIAYAEKLAKAGVPVEHRHAEDQMHGFLLHSKVIRKAGQLLDVVADALRLQARNHWSSLEADNQQ
jgi:acetyl esterase